MNGSAISVCRNGSGWLFGRVVYGLSKRPGQMDCGEWTYGFTRGGLKCWLNRKADLHGCSIQAAAKHTVTLGWRGCRGLGAGPVKGAPDDQRDKQQDKGFRTQRLHEVFPLNPNGVEDPETADQCCAIRWKSSPPEVDPIPSSTHDEC